MPIFRNKLPAESKNHGLDLRRTPATSPLQAIITCESLIVCDTHFWHGRTMPCERATNEEGKTIDDSMCKACSEKQPYRTHVYVSCFNPKSHESFLFECTATAAKPLEEYYQVSGTLRGCVLYASRPKGGPNSKVLIQTNSIDQRKTPLPQPPNIPAVLAIIWRLPRQAIEISLDDFRPPEIKTVESELNAIRNQEDDAAGIEAFQKRRLDVLQQLSQQPKPNGKSKPKKVPT